MALPRPTSIFDTLEPTGMYKRPREDSGPVAVTPDLTMCSDEEFERWLASAPRDAGGERGLPQTDQTMMNAWMTLSLAATANQIAYTAAVHLRTDKSPAVLNAPQWGMYNEDADQRKWEDAQLDLASKRGLAMQCVARAERVKPLVFN